MKVNRENCVVSNNIKMQRSFAIHTLFYFTEITNWFEAFNTPNDPPDFIPPAYIALEIPQSDIKSERFKRDANGYVGNNRFVRQVSE